MLASWATATPVGERAQVDGMPEQVFDMRPIPFFPAGGRNLPTIQIDGQPASTVRGCTETGIRRSERLVDEST